MKEVIRLEKREEAVSPVIATILMVAITVVLAATVYILVSHYTSVGATTPLTATLSEISEGGGSVIFSLSLSTPSSITADSNIHLTASGLGMSAPLTLTFKGPSTPDYWLSAKITSGIASGEEVLVTFTNTNGNPASSGGYVASGATMNVYIINWQKNGITFTGSAPSGIDTSITVSGLSISMTVTGYSGTVTATAP